MLLLFFFIQQFTYHVLSEYLNIEAPFSHRKEPTDIFYFIQNYDFFQFYSMLYYNNFSTQMINQNSQIEIEHVVCGGGLVGALWALYLRRKSTSVAIFQSYYDLRQELIPGGRSINLVLSKKALDSLQQIGIKEQILKNTIPIKGQVVHCSDGSTYNMPYGLDENEVSYCISRNKLNQILYNIVQTNNIPIYFQHTLIDGNIQTNQYLFKFNDCDEQLQVKIKAKYMYGADGAGSKVRDLIMNKSGKQAHIQWYPADYKEIFLPASPITGGYFFDPNWVHIWPRGGHMMMGHPNSNGTFSMTLILPSKGPHSFEALTQQKIQQYFMTYYPDLYELIPNLPLQSSQNPVGYLGTIRVPNWSYKDKVVLLGDSAHTICPFLWQAVNIGMDDCLHLNKMIDRYGFEQKAFSQYFQIQKIKADALAEITIGNFDNIATLPDQKQFHKVKQLQKQIQRHWPKKYWSKYRLIFYGDRPYNQILKLIKIYSNFIYEARYKWQKSKTLPLKQIEQQINKLNLSDLNNI